MIEEIKNALEILKNGGIILYPTDTIWGIGCDATNAEAVSKVYQLKQREDSKSLIILLDHPNRLNSYIDVIPDIAWDLIEVTDKPLTIIYPGAKNLAKNVINSDGTVGIRITTDEFCKNLISKFQKPLVSTSANISGDPHPSNYVKIHPDIIKNVDYVVNWRQEETSGSEPSSIIKLGLGGQVEVIR